MIYWELNVFCCGILVCVVLREKHNLSVFQNWLLRTFRPKREEGAEGSSNFCIEPLFYNVWNFLPINVGFSRR
jgi:hypothetical protein